jgi:3-oxoacyl-[acyl-carrier-protein] synthase II
MSAERIAVTGIAAWSAYGRGVEPILAAIESGRRALGAFRRLSDDPLLPTAPVFAAPGWTAAAGADPWRWACEQAVATARDAVAAARLEHPPGRIAICNGTTHGCDEGYLYLSGVPDPELLTMTAALLAKRIAHAVGATGPNFTFNTACSSGLHALGRAALLLAAGEADAAVAGGNDIVSRFTYLGFNSLRALSPDGCRPLDQRRDGLTLGDGAAYLVLERESDARRRGARVLGFIAGYGAAADGYHATAPDPSGAGAERVMRRALVAVDAGALRLIAAHATGTPANDAVESEAICRIVRELAPAGPIYMFALKSWLGHTLGAAGALEAAVTLACMQRELVPGTWGLREPVAHDAPLVLPRVPQRVAARLALCNAFGFGGNLASLCLQSSEEPA